MCFDAAEKCLPRLSLAAGSVGRDCTNGTLTSTVQAVNLVSTYRRLSTSSLASIADEALAPQSATSCLPRAFSLSQRARNSTLRRASHAGDSVGGVWWALVLLVPNPAFQGTTTRPASAATPGAIAPSWDRAASYSCRCRLTCYTITMVVLQYLLVPADSGYVLGLHKARAPVGPVGHRVQQTLQQDGPPPAYPALWADHVCSCHPDDGANAPTRT
jgi:hypothetical protein